MHGFQVASCENMYQLSSLLSTLHTWKDLEGWKGSSQEIPRTQLLRRLRDFCPISTCSKMFQSNVAPPSIPFPQLPTTSPFLEPPRGSQVCPDCQASVHEQTQKHLKLKASAEQSQKMRLNLIKLENSMCHSKKYL